MAENLGQIDVVIQSDNQTLPMPGGGGGGKGGSSSGAPFGPPRPIGLGGTGVPGSDVIGKGKALANKRLAMFAKVAVAAAAVVGVLIVVKKVVEGVVKVITAVMRTLIRWDSQVQGLINKFAQLNGSAALAGAITKLGELTGNLQQAKILGPMLLQMTKARESFMKVSNAAETVFNVVKITVLEAFYRVVAALVQPLIDAWGGLDNLARAARILTLLFLKVASTVMKIIGWAAKIASFFSGGLIGGAMIGGLGSFILSVGEKLDEAVDAINKQTQEILTIEDMKNIIMSNAMTLGHLEHMTGGVWRHSTQVPLQAATGREINPRQWAAREAAKKQRRSP